jgi:hypothetical protein
MALILKNVVKNGQEERFLRLYVMKKDEGLSLFS